MPPSSHSAPCSAFSFADGYVDFVTFLFVDVTAGVAGMLLCAILSDTLNLMGPTTTDWDRMMVAVLCQIAQVKDINALVKAQFKAKSKELECTSAASASAAA